MQSNGNETPQSAQTGLEVLICGAGVAGLRFALECKKNGLQPRIVESRFDIDTGGDFIAIGESVRRGLKYWPKLEETWVKKSKDVWNSYYKHNGEHIVGPIPMNKNFGKLFLRPTVYSMLLEEIERQGISIRYGCKVVRYFEEDDHGGVELEGGEILTADVVAAADGAHSHSEGIVKQGNPEVPTSSGMSIYRCAFDAKWETRDVAMREAWEPKEEYEEFRYLIGPRMHAIVLPGKDTIAMILAHADTQNTSSESWSARLDPEHMLQFLDETPGWDSSFYSLVKTIPPKSIVDWRIMWRNPETQWVSPKGRVVQIGDAAHLILPTSANGATQAMEDTISLAACLRLGGGKAGVPLATRVHNHLRYQRTSCVQYMGVLNRQIFQFTDWKAVSKNPMLIARMAGSWLADHDPEQYAIDNFEACAKHLTDGSEFTNTNIPKGYTYRPWNVHEVLRDQAAGKMQHPEGEW